MNLKSTHKKSVRKFLVHNRKAIVIYKNRIKIKIMMAVKRAESGNRKKDLIKVLILWLRLKNFFFKLKIHKMFTLVNH